MLVSPHLRQDGVEAAEALLGTGPVSLDPGFQQAERLSFQAYGPGPRPLRPADEPGVPKHPHVLVDGLQRHPVRLGRPARRRVALGERVTTSRRVGSARAANTRDNTPLVMLPRLQLSG
jgi:hypothetical protein